MRLLSREALNRTCILTTAVCNVALATIACSDAPGTTVSDGAYTASRQPLFVRSSVVWPVSNDEATISVCWLPIELGTDERFPVDNLAPDLSTTLPTLKAWAREVVEAQWNDLTPLNFIGWEDCDGSPVDVRIRPIGSAYRAPGCGTGSDGQSCAEALGTDLGNDEVALNLNLLFGEEVRYSSRYQQTAGAAYQANLDLDYWWLPTPCVADFWRPWTTTNPESPHLVNIDDPDAASMFEEIYRSCLQYNVLHEFGHVAGFAHEQYRQDDPQQQAACYEYNASLMILDEIPSRIPTRYRGTTPLGPFDSESIMSYCRRDWSPTLSEQDIAMAHAAYAGEAGDSKDSGVGGVDGLDGGTSGTTAGSAGTGGSEIIADAGQTDAGGSANSTEGDGQGGRRAGRVAPPPEHGGCSVTRWRHAHNAHPLLVHSGVLGLALALRRRLKTRRTKQQGPR